MKITSWVKVFNELEKEKQYEILSFIYNLEKFREEKLNDVVVEIYTLSQEADDVEIFNLNTLELMEKVDYLHHNFNNMILKYNDRIKDIDIETDFIIDKVNEVITIMGKQAVNFVNGNITKYTYNINATLVKNRLFLFRKRAINMMNEFLNKDRTLENEIDYARDTISSIKRIALKRVKNECASLENSIKEDKKKSKIFNYKEMNRLAKLKGYVTDHCTGDHLILVHMESRKAIVVPQKKLGKGLSFAIQKQMKTNSI